MSLANDLDVVWAVVADSLAEAFHTDTYQIRAVSHLPDGRGGTTEQTVIVESGACALDLDTSRSGERQIGDRLVTRSTYLITLPVSSVVATTSDLRVNGRRFNPVDVKRDGDWATETLVWAEEVL